jgi:hypothetical protein
MLASVGKLKTKSKEVKVKLLELLVYVSVPLITEEFLSWF